MSNAPDALQPEKPARYAYYVLLVLLLANLMNYVDRFVLSAVLPLIEKDWGISKETQGLLSSAFTVGFMLSAPLIGALADRRNRPRIVAVCVFVWSLATVGAGLAPSIGWMLAFRVVIGVGEAGLLVVGPTLVADSFPRTARARALSIFYLGTPLGGAIGYGFGGAIGEIFTWRHPLVVAGIVGIVPTILIWFMREPERGAYDTADHHLHAHGKGGGSFRDYLVLAGNVSFLLVVVCLAAASMAGTPLMHFLPGYMLQHRGIPLKEGSLLVGIVAAIAGTLGTIAFGAMADALFKRTRRAHFLLAGIAYLIAYPCILAGLYAGPRTVYLGGLGLGIFMVFGALTTLNTLVANVTRPVTRAMAYSALIFCMHLFGDTFSPPFFGKVIDQCVAKEGFFYQVLPWSGHGIESGFFYMTLPFMLCAVACLFGLPRVATDLRRATDDDTPAAKPS
jgi:MFS transporter, Spinster family, sphingosine-1-phosphate transporter